MMKESVLKSRIIINSAEHPTTLIRGRVQSERTICVKEKNRTRKSVSLAEKLQIIKAYDSGKRNNELAKKFGIHHSTISQIVKQKVTISEHHKILKKVGGSIKKKRWKGTEESPFETALYQWFKQKQNLGEPINGPLLKEKALWFHQQINGKTSFSASEGWLARFKKRHCIRSLKTRQKNISCKQYSCKEFEEQEIVDEDTSVDMEDSEDDESTPLQILQAAKKLYNWSRSKTEFTTTDRQVLQKMCAIAFHFAYPNSD